jgi:hypothetical protein
VHEFVDLLERLQTIEIRGSADVVLSDLKQVAAEASEVSLSTDFAQYAASEYKQADIFRYLTIGTLVAAFGFTAWLAFTESEFSWTHVILKVLLDVPILAAAYYFSSESRDHRTNGRRAREWQVRLNTIRAYTAELPDEPRIRIRTEMGLAVFREPPMLGLPDSLADVNSKLVAQVVDVIKATKGT